MKERYAIVLTAKELTELQHIVDNGWGDGSFSGWGGADVKAQKRSMKKLSNPIHTRKGAKVLI